MGSSAPNFTYEGSLARVRIGAGAIPSTKLTPPKQNIKLEKLARIGEAVKTIRTIGTLDCEGGAVELESAVFAELLIPRMPPNGWTMFEFSIHVVQRHPLVGGPYSAFWNRVRFTGTEEEAIEASEKATRISLPVDVIQIFYAGRDGVFKSLVQQAGLPPPTMAQFTL